MLRIATYNIKHCSLKGVGAVADVLRALDADLIALQEVDVGVARSHGVDQSRALGERLGMHPTHGPAFPLEGGHYGVGLLSRFPIVREEVIALPSAAPVPLPEGVEPRVALDVCVELPEGLAGGAGPLHVVVTHFGLDAEERLGQAEALVDHLAGRPRTLVVGDLNEGPDAGGFRLLAGIFVDGLAEAGIADRRTFPTGNPVLAIDHVLRTRDLPAARSARRIEVDASDHLPLVLELG